MYCDVMTCKVVQCNVCMYVCMRAACMHACMHIHVRTDVVTWKARDFRIREQSDRGIRELGLIWSGFKKDNWRIWNQTEAKQFVAKKTNSETKVLLSCTAGPLAGHHIFVTEMSSYWMHQSGVTYKGVARCLVSRCRCGDSCVVWLDTNLVHSPAAA